MESTTCETPRTWLRNKERQEASPRRDCFVLALQNGVAPGILIDLNFDPAVLGTALCSLVVSDRFGFAESLTRDPAAFHTLLRYIIPNRHPTPIRQLQIVGFRPDAVRVTR